jgi:hypothetical protein
LVAGSRRQRALSRLQVALRGLPGRRPRQAVRQRAAPDSTGHQFERYDVEAAVRMLIVSTDAKFIELVMAKVGEAKSYKFYTLAAHGGIVGVVPKYLVAKDRWTEWSLTKNKRNKPALGVDMVISQRGDLVAAEVASYFTPLDEITPLVSPLKAKMNADAAVALAALSFGSPRPEESPAAQRSPKVRFSTAQVDRDVGLVARVGLPLQPVEPSAVAPSPPPLVAKCETHKLFESVDLNIVFEACENGQPPFGFPERCAASDAKRPSFWYSDRSFVWLLGLRLAAGRCPAKPGGRSPASPSRGPPRLQPCTRSLPGASICPRRPLTRARRVRFCSSHRLREPPRRRLPPSFRFRP